MGRCPSSGDGHCTLLSPGRGGGGSPRRPCCTRVCEHTHTRAHSTHPDTHTVTCKLRSEERICKRKLPGRLPARNTPCAPPPPRTPRAQRHIDPRASYPSVSPTKTSRKRYRMPKGQHDLLYTILFSAQRMPRFITDINGRTVRFMGYFSL